ncbi:MAG: choice-of-anchor tandem repeat GloVer-containing protein [Terriglobales bacterium]
MFELSSTGVETVLYSFNKQSGDGYLPYSGVVFGKKGTLYGTTFYGGVHGQGTVFELSPTGVEQLLYSFGGRSSDGINPYGSVVFDKKGNLYGSTIAGGLYGQGTVFELSPAGEEKILYTFGSQASDGASPVGGLVLDTAGNLYGVTAYGGAYGFGTIFEITP